MQWMLIDENVNGRIIRNLYSRCKRGGVGEREHKRENGGLGARDEKGRSLVPSPQSPIFLPRSLLFPFPTYAATQATFV